MPLVSIITPARNAAATLGRCHEGVRNQDFPDWEHIVVDDGSTDETAEIVARLSASDARVRSVHLNAGSGSGAARNAGMARAQGRIISFLDADDEWLPGKLSAQINFMRQENVSFSYGSYWLIGPGSGATRQKFSPPSKLTYRELLNGNIIGCLTAAFDRQVLGEVEMLETSRAQDWSAWLKLARRTSRIAAYPGTHAIYHWRLTPLFMVPQKLAGVWRIYRESENLELFPAASSLARHVMYRLLFKSRYISDD